MKRTILTLLAACSLAAASSASIVSTAGQTTWLASPPPSAWLGALTGANAYVWNERQNQPAGFFPVNINVNPSVNTGYVPQLNSVFVPAVASHMIHFEPARGAPLQCVGSVTFSTPVIGVIYSGLWLSGSDPLFGAPATTYYTFGWGRSYGMFLGQSIVSVSGNTVSFDLRPNYAGILMSELRVLTRPVPAPATLALAGLGALACGRRRR